MREAGLVTMDILVDPFSGEFSRLSPVDIAHNTSPVADVVGDHIWMLKDS